MAPTEQLFLGEYHRLLDERFRVSLPADLATPLAAQPCILAKERPGALSLWFAADWQDRLDRGVAWMHDKIRAGKLQNRMAEVQQLGRLLSTRHTPIQLAGRGRLTIPEGFREFLEVEPGSEVLIVGAAICVEIWRIDRWVAYLNEHIGDFHPLFQELTE